MLINSLS